VRQTLNADMMQPAAKRFLTFSRLARCLFHGLSLSTRKLLHTNGVRTETLEYRERVRVCLEQTKRPHNCLSKCSTGVYSGHYRRDEAGQKLISENYRAKRVSGVARNARVCLIGLWESVGVDGGSQLAPTCEIFWT